VIQERLRNLRASLGSSRLPGESDHAEAPLALLPPPCTAAVGHAAAPTVAVEGESLSGLCTMLGHHLDVLEASQQPLKSALQSYEASAEDSAELKCAEVQQVVGQVMLEAGAMRSTLHVLSACLPVLPAKPANAGSQTGTSVKDSAAAPGSFSSGQELQAKEDTVSTAAAAAATAAVAELKAKAQKWKIRCQELKREMAVAAAAAASREAAVAERLAAAEVCLSLTCFASE
jgi:hypothetical protein